MSQNTANPDPIAWRAVSALYNALVTGLVVSLVVRRGTETAREYVFRHFRRQHLEKFLPGLAKLGLAGHPHAVACALYHYHSNALGGVKTEYFRQSDRKAWVRYPPPRWMWKGTAIAAIPHEVSAAMLHGWHGHNGVSLGNPRLGFVCTGMTVDGLPGLEGYYVEHDRDLSPAERVRFAYGEETMPRFDPSAAPRLEAASWPLERLERTRRRYAMDYVRTMLAVLDDLPGIPDPTSELARVARLIGLQFYEEAAAEIAVKAGQTNAGAFASWLQSMLAGQGEEITSVTDGESTSLHLTGWKLPKGLDLKNVGATFTAWNELWIGACAAHDRFLRLDASASIVDGKISARWEILPRA